MKNLLFIHGLHGIPPRTEIISLCPQCGERIYSYENNSFNDECISHHMIWSDGYSGNDSFGISRCPLCGCCFDRDSAKELVRREEEHKPEIQTVYKDDYDSVKVALQTLDFNLLSERTRKNVYLAFIHAFNTKFYRIPCESNVEDEADSYDSITLDGISSLFPSREDRRLFRCSVAELIPLLDEEPLLQAELLRETGQYKRALILLDELKTACEISPARLQDINVLISLCHSRDCRPFSAELPSNKPQTHCSPQKNEKIVVRILNKLRTLRKNYDRNHEPIKRPERFP